MYIIHITDLCKFNFRTSLASVCAHIDDAPRFFSYADGLIKSILDISV